MQLPALEGERGQELEVAKRGEEERERESGRGFPHSLQLSTTRLVYIRSGGFGGSGEVCNRRRKRAKGNPQICESFFLEGERGESSMKAVT